MISQVHGLLPPGWNATLLAVDGSTTGDVAGQLDRLPPDATDLVLSVGGNDALNKLGSCDLPVSNMPMAIGVLSDVRMEFERRYALAVGACLGTGLPVTLCTIYNGCFADVSFQRIASTMLTVFNDAIIRAAVQHALPLIDLRAVCASREDYANPIEPSSVGGAKIARAIIGLVCNVRRAVP